MMIQLIYASKASKPFTSDELVDLLEKSREKNATLNITGMLLYRHESFMQVLEGEKDAVNQLYEVIKQDKRHQLVRTIASKKIEQRVFEEWEMGFREIKDDDMKSIEGFSKYLDEPFYSKTFTKDLIFVHTFLRAFKYGLI